MTRVLTCVAAGLLVLTASACEFRPTMPLREEASFSGKCVRSAEYWCQNRGDENANLSREEFFDLATFAATTLLKDVGALNTSDEVAAAVCNTGNQFQRQLASLALNLSTEILKLDTNLVGERAPYRKVRDVVEAAIAHLTGSKRLSSSEQQALKDAMERINNAENLEGCDAESADEAVTPPSQR